jgi:hypothetical protein
VGKDERKRRKSKSGRTPKPVFSPELPPEAWDLFAEHPELMAPASAPAPKTGSDLRRTPGESVAALFFFAGLEVGLWFLARWILHAVFPDGLAAWLSGGAAVFGVFLLIAAFVGASTESQQRSLARKHHGEYLLAEDWDEEATALMLRAQQAVRAVQKSEVNKQGLLDAVKNDVVLPEQLWDLGRVLQQQSVLRARQAELGKGLGDAQLDQILGPQRQALKLSATAMEEKVAKLERYAEQVHNADAVLRAETVAAIAAVDTDRYVELLASTEIAGDSSLIEDLSKDTSRVHSTLAGILAAALETGQTLALPSKQDPPPAG